MKLGAQRIIPEGRKFLIALTQDDCVPKSKKHADTRYLLAKNSQSFTKFTEGKSAARRVAQWILIWLCLLVTTAAAATVPGTIITNQAQVNYVASSTSFSVASNVATVTVLGQTNYAELSVAGDYPISNPGDTLNLSARLTNAGSNTLRNGQLSFKVPLDAAVTSGSGVSMRLDGDTVTATVPDLAVGASTTLRFGLVLPTRATQGTAAMDFN